MITTAHHTHAHAAAPGEQIVVTQSQQKTHPRDLDEPENDIVPPAVHPTYTASRLMQAPAKHCVRTTCVACHMLQPIPHPGIDQECIESPSTAEIGFPDIAMASCFRGSEAYPSTMYQHCATQCLDPDHGGAKLLQQVRVPQMVTARLSDSGFLSLAVGSTKSTRKASLCHAVVVAVGCSTTAAGRKWKASQEFRE